MIKSFPEKETRALFVAQIDSVTTLGECLQNFTPQQRAQKEVACAKLLAALSTAIQSLAEKANKPLGGGITAESPMRGIHASALALLEAMRNPGQCMGCNNLFI